MQITANVENLSAANVGVTPNTVEAWSGEMFDDDRVQYWESFGHRDDNGRDWTLVTNGGSGIAGVLIGGRLYEVHEFDTYAEDNDAVIDSDAMDSDEWDTLFNVEPDSAEGPRMNFWYECAEAGDNPALTAALIGGSVCVVEVDGTYGFALTGGGMDLTWEIVGAYVATGCLPPAHYARDLPAMGDRGTSEVDRVLIAACVRSLEITRDRATFAIGLLTERFPA